MSAFLGLVESLRLRHFAAEEVESHGLPDQLELVYNIGPTLIIADCLRDAIGGPLRITSAYRSPARNASTPGASALSQHQRFSALDLVWDQSRLGSPGVVAALLRGWRGRLFSCATRCYSGAGIKVAAGEVPWKPLQVFDERSGPGSVFTWRGGVGEYAWGVHIDSRGFDADW